MNTKRKSVATKLAEHFGWDVADLRDFNYQPGRFTPRVYAGMLSKNEYWSAGSTPPKDRDECGFIWERVESSFPGGGTLWVSTKAKDD
ncbi:hypothetical protein UFOVP605_46 [uncultured Caudovirales phage]|uniref:Uncharacterized protein n=1 Tax=uncultured Caudovirales phage TaxID=2100421 RepID=A0A6J5N469_9CAUD|nr:hypothetical protein UFOVP605_46 [uncultured Caudovirales phage]